MRPNAVGAVEQHGGIAMRHECRNLSANARKWKVYRASKVHVVPLNLLAYIDQHRCRSAAE
jgi:hypothetical protein